MVSHRAKTTRHNSLLPQLWAKFSSPIICLCWPHSPDLQNSQYQEPRVQTGATPTHRGQTSDTERRDRLTSLLRRSLHICLHLPTLATSKKLRSNFPGGVGGEGYILHSLPGAKYFPAPAALKADGMSRCPWQPR